MSDIRAQAIAAYNRAFELIIEGSQSDLLEGLELAAASLHLWRQVGTDRNVAIGQWLMSRGYQKAGAFELSVEAAQIAIDLADADWMLASGLEAMTRAHIGRPEFQVLRDRASDAIEKIEDPQEKEIIAEQFSDLLSL